DIRDLNIREFEKDRPEFIWASPPCQQFSTANPRRDPEKGLELVRVAYSMIVRMAPKAWVIENVRGANPYISALLERGAFLRNGAWYLWGECPMGILDNANRLRKGVPIPPRLRWMRSHHRTYVQNFGEARTEDAQRIPKVLAEAVHRAVCDYADK